MTVHRHVVKLSLLPLARKTPGSLMCRSQRAFRNTSYIREGLYECECRYPTRIEIYCFIGNHLNAEGEGGSFMKLPRRSGCSESGYFELRVSTLSVRSFAPGTSKLLLKLLTIRRSQIKIRAFFVEVEIVPRVERHC